MSDNEVSSGPRVLWHADLIVVLFILVNLLMVLTIRILGSQMYPFFIAYYVWIPLYTSLIAAFLYRERLREKAKLKGGFPVYLVVILTIAARLAFVGQTELISLDPLWYLDFGKSMQMGLTPYYGFHFPYPPVFAYFILLITWIAPSVDSFRLLATLMDAGVVIVVWKLASRIAGPRWGGTASLMYALLPISIIESGWNGHFEPIANLLMLASLWFLLKGQHRMSGLMLGLGAATKVYPAALFPLFLFYFKGQRTKLEFLFVTIASAAVTFLPFLVADFIIGGTWPPGSSSPAGTQFSLFSSLLNFLSNPNVVVVAVNMVAIGGAVLGTVVTIRQLLRGTPESYWREYQWTTLVLGVILILAGMVAGLYPLTAASRLVEWRYPVDIGIVRGIGAVGIGLMIVREAYKSRKGLDPHTTSAESLIVLVSATMMLLLVMSRRMFFGWYLLWSLPLLLLLRNKRLVLTAVLCFLLLYPSYTQDNFASLGSQEQRLWSDEFESVEGWACFVNVSDSGLDPSQILAGVEVHSQSGRFWINTTGVDNATALRNVSVSLTTAVSIAFDSMTEFVTRITCSWDPMFGKVSDLSLSYVGVDSIGDSVNGNIIARTGRFTNLTHILWRYALSTEISDGRSGTVENLTFTIYPAIIGEYWYAVDFMYTVYAGPLNPMYFLFIPILTAMSLAAYIPLERENGKWILLATKKDEMREETPP